MAASPVPVAILGASGYTGGELLRLLARHGGLRPVALTAERQAGRPVAAVHPQLAGLNLPDLVRIEEVDWGGVAAVLCALPHGTTQAVIAALPRHLKVVDLSADFRLVDPSVYAEWYGHAHRAPDLQAEAVYGLTEHARAAVRAARLVANPGCYPTAALLPLLPLLGAGVIEAEDVIIDAKSGVSGAGRELKAELQFCEVAEGLHAYGVGRHRHMPEIEQELARVAGRAVTVSFTPHLVPMNRGELATCHVRLANGAGADDLRQVLAARYREEPFIQVLPAGGSPATRHVRGANTCLIAVFADRIPGRAIVLSAIDNLVKGASGQALQNLNLMLGLPETQGLIGPALFP